MTVENGFRETREAGLLDKVVKTITLGKYGVDEIVGIGFKDSITGEIFQEHPTVHALKTMKSVAVMDMSKTHHVLSRKIVKR